MPQVKTFKNNDPGIFDREINKWLDENAGKTIIHQFLYGGGGNSSSSFLMLTIVYDEVKGGMFGENIKKQQ